MYILIHNAGGNHQFMEDQCDYFSHWAEALIEVTSALENVILILNRED